MTSFGAKRDKELFEILTEVIEAMQSCSGLEALHMTFALMSKARKDMIIEMGDKETKRLLETIIEELGKLNERS